MSVLLRCVALTILVPSIALAQSAEPLVAELRAQQPAVEALEARVQALDEAAAAARLWSDPRAMIELSNLPATAPWIDQHPMAGIQLKLQQRFPAPGEPQARAAAADARTEAARAGVDVLLRRLEGEVRGRFEDLASVRQQRGVVAEHVAELDDLLAVVDARYQVGVADQHDLLQLQLRRDRLAQALPDLDARAAALEAALNGALARPASTAIPTPASPAMVPLDGSVEDRRGALETHPVLLALHAQASAERAQAERQRIEARPDPTVWLGYRVRAPQSNGDPGTNFATAGVSVPLPAASTRRHRAAALSAESRARAAESSVEAQRARLTADLAAAETRHARAVERAAAYRDSLENAAQAALESTRSAYQVGRAGFADLIRAEIDLLDVRRERLRAEADAAKARAAIVTLIGASP